MKAIGIILSAILLSIIARGQQQAMYTQYMFNNQAINPAYSAMEESLRVTALSRLQWTGFKGAPRTQSLSVHSPIGESNTFIGGILADDRAGEVLKETGAYFTLAQRVEVGEDGYLAVGFNGGFSSFRGDYSQLYAQSPESVNDPVFQNTSVIRGNFGAGVMLFTPRFYMGVSSPYFYQRSIASAEKAEGSLRNKPHYYFQAGTLWDVSYDFKYKPGVLVKYVNGSPIQFDISSSILLMEKFWLGASYRSMDSFNFMASVFVTPDVQFGYSYDMAHTELRRYQKGSHEVMLKFRFAVRGRDHLACYF
ncbi:PorP/SprF family type IX secretion system membrane protein [Desertivirga arenae]|uniref:PorP/SprF family type IX secretion system membrane protein n=1 Tax=Desertivirga arenae TaxID=2810309 RepID=UPI001A9762F9|nr:type IX secretion system membrane protein PorP/SprF [Pedobacter sp. SYSU D00823]